MAIKGERGGGSDISSQMLLKHTKIKSQWPLKPSEVKGMDEILSSSLPLEVLKREIMELGTGQIR